MTGLDTGVKIHRCTNYKRSVWSNIVTANSGAESAESHRSWSLLFRVIVAKICLQPLNDSLSGPDGPAASSGGAVSTAHKTHKRLHYVIILMLSQCTRHVVMLPSAAETENYNTSQGLFFKDTAKSVEKYLFPPNMNNNYYDY